MYIHVLRILTTYMYMCNYRITGIFGESVSREIWRTLNLANYRLCVYGLRVYTAYWRVLTWRFPVLYIRQFAKLNARQSFPLNGMYSIVTGKA